MNLQGKKVTIHDMTLRDGMHPKRHRMSLEQMIDIATGLDAAGVPLIEVTHGDGLGGSSVNYGFPAHSDTQYLGAVIPRMKQAKVSALLIPGIGTVDHLRMAHGLGVHTIRVATHCTEADVSEQHITMARKLDLDTVGFLMMAHMASPQKLVEQALLMEGYGANCIYVTDSAGYMLPDDVKARIAAVRVALKPGTELGFHGHHNLAMGVANSIAAVEAGANASTRPLRVSARARATRRWKCSWRSASAWASRPAWTYSRSRTWQRTAWCRSWTSPSASTAIRSPWATPACIRASCFSPGARSRSGACPRARSSSSSAGAAWWVVRKT